MTNMYMVLLTIDDPGKCRAVLDAWSEAGAPGATMLPSTGLDRIRSKYALTGDMPLLPSLADFLEKEEDRHNTIFSIVCDHDIVKRLVKATESVLGDLNLPRTGIMVVLPVLEAYGLERRDD
ncbi:MAG: hypothetical protein AAGU05_00810 [Anaerolineaceae bacterium]